MFENKKCEGIEKNRGLLFKSIWIACLLYGLFAAGASDLALDSRQTDPTNTYFVRVTGDDLRAVRGDSNHAWRTPSGADMAIRDAVARGDTNRLVMDILGSYDLGVTPLWPTNNVTIQGAGTNATILYYEGDEHSNGPAIMSSDGQWVRDLTVICRQPAGSPSPPSEALRDQTAFGALSDSPNSNYVGTNSIAGCLIVAGAHAVQLNPVITNGSARINLYQTTVHANNAAIETANPHSTIYARDFLWQSTEPEPHGRLFMWGVENFGGAIILRNGTVQVTGFPEAKQVFGLATGRLSGSAMTGPATNDLGKVTFNVQAGGSTGAIADIEAKPKDYSATLLTNDVRRMDGKALIVKTNSLVIF